MSKLKLMVNTLLICSSGEVVSGVRSGVGGGGERSGVEGVVLSGVL